jgi:hypothetical protein
MILNGLPCRAVAAMVKTVIATTSSADRNWPIDANISF